VRARAKARAAAPSIPSLRALHPAAARWIGALIRMTAPHPAMTAVLDAVGRLQLHPYRTNFVLLGEPGTGKEGLARALAHLTCPKGPLVRFDVTGFSDEDSLAALAGSGKRRGAAAEAKGGTLLIEEAAGLGARTQEALIRLLKTDPTTHAIAMSDRDLEADVRAGRFRHDLYWRLARIVLTLPPLRERKQDVGPAAIWMGNRILRTAGLGLELERVGRRRLRRRSPSRGEGDPLRVPQRLVTSDEFARMPAAERATAIELRADAVLALAEHDWSGNFRELEAVLERALLLCRDPGSPLTADAVRAAI
jgi:DNA-binding NtrC family response regulator